jgi:hypothetical protein
VAIPEFVENIEIRADRRGLWAYIDGKMLGKVTKCDGHLDVTLLGKPFRWGQAPADPRDVEIKDLKDSQMRLVDALKACKERNGE